MDVNVSLTFHLRESLSALVPLLPPDLKHTVESSLSQSVVPYQVLRNISTWARQPASQSKLTSANLNPHSYGMVPLLAGTTTNPEKIYPPDMPRQKGELSRRQQDQTRKQVTALLNALLSIVGAGVGAWIIARNVGWKNEWRVLLGLVVAIVVALAEGGLYLIYASRAEPRKRSRPRVDKKIESTAEEESPVAVKEDSTERKLRRRVKK